MRAPGESTTAARIHVVEDDPEIQYLFRRIPLEDDREVMPAGPEG